MSVRDIAAVACLASMLSGCGGVVDPSTNTIENFTNSFEVGNLGPVHQFSTSKNGEFFVTLTALTDATAFVGIVWGQQTANGCAQISSNNFARVNQQAISGPIDKANYCLQVYDSGASPLSGRQTYTVRVSHP